MKETCLKQVKWAMYFSKKSFWFLFKMNELTDVLLKLLRQDGNNF